MKNTMICLMCVFLLLMATACGNGSQSEIHADNPDDAESVSLEVSESGAEGTDSETVESDDGESEDVNIVWLYASTIRETYDGSGISQTMEGTWIYNAESGILTGYSSYFDEITETTESSTAAEYTYNEYGELIKRIEYADVNGSIGVHEEYGYDADGNMIEYFKYLDDIAVVYNRYDSAGNVLNVIYRNADGSINGEYTYEYNVDGQIIQKTGNNSETSYVYTYEYEYNVNRQIVKKVTYRDDDDFDCTEYEYDSDGNMIKETSNSSYYEYVYNTDGNLLQKDCYYKHIVDGVSSYTSSSYGYEYDTAGNMIKETYISDSDPHEYCYDANGNPTKLLRYSSDGSIESCYEYEYDADGNMIKETAYVNDITSCYIKEYQPIKFKTH